VSKKTKTTRYLVYRQGANGANQGGANSVPVAIVTARSRAEACETDSVIDGGLVIYTWLKADGDIGAYANQSFYAVPESKAKSSDWDRVLESRGCVGED